MPLLIWCLCIVHFSSNKSIPQHYQRSTRKGWNLVGQVSIASTEHHWCSGVLSVEYLLLFSKHVLWAGWRCSYGVSVKSYSGKHVHGTLWQRSSPICLHLPRYWLRYVDDTFVIQQQPHSGIPIVNLWPAHTDQYLQRDSHHNLSAKYSAIGTLTHRVKTVCTCPELFQRKIQHLREALGSCKYPGWAIQKVQSKYINCNQEDNRNNNQEVNPSEDTHTHNPSSNTQGRSTPRDKPSTGNIVIPYTYGLGESFKKTCGRYGIQTHFKGSSTLIQLFIRPKDQDLKEKKSGVIYSYQCEDTTCDEEYIGETSKTLGERYWEHLKRPS